MRMRIPLVIAGLLVATALIWLALFRTGEAPGGISASGTVEATESDLGFVTGGRIAQVQVREGDRVAAGSVLARLDAEELEARQAQAAAQVAAARARLDELERGARPAERAQARATEEAARERLEDAARSLERTRVLYDGGAVAREVLDRAETAHRVAAAQHTQALEQLRLVLEGAAAEQLAAQRAVVRQAEAAHEQVRVAVDRTRLVAPSPGIVTVRHRQAGESVSPGAPVVTLMDPDDRWVRIYVPGDEVGRVALGQAARISSDSHPDSIFTGRVTYIASEAEFTPRNVQTSEERVKLVYAVKVAIDGDRGLALKPGMPADIRFETDAR